MNIHEPIRRVLSIRQTWRLATMLVMIAAAPSAAQADSVRLSNFWVPVARVMDIRDNVIIYQGATGAEAERPLVALQGIRLDDYPLLERAEQAMDQQNWEAAAASFAELTEQVREDWLQGWVRYRWMVAANNADQSMDAVRQFVELTRKPAFRQGAYFADPPLETVAQLDDQGKAQVRQMLEPLADRTRGAVKEAVEKMIVALGDQAATVLDATVSDSVIPLPKAMFDEAADDDVTRALAQGRFEEALNQADKILEQRTSKMAMRLFQKGAAQLALAERFEGDAQARRKKFLDAGLTFMRVAIYFPASRYTGPSLVEAGLVHRRIDRLDVAAKLYSKAGNELDERDNPVYFGRLQELLEDLSNAS